LSSISVNAPSVHSANNQTFNFQPYGQGWQRGHKIMAPSAGCSSQVPYEEGQGGNNEGDFITSPLAGIQVAALVLPYFNLLFKDVGLPINRIALVCPYGITSDDEGKNKCSSKHGEVVKGSLQSADPIQSKTPGGFA
jgi:hypothetical protein